MESVKETASLLCIYFPITKGQSGFIVREDKGVTERKLITKIKERNKLYFNNLV